MLLPMVLVFGIAFTTAFTLSPIAAALGRRWDIVDRPRPGEVQERVVARTGGYALVVAFVAGVAISMLVVQRSAAEQHRLIGLLLGVAMILPLAVADDLRRLEPLPQLAGQVAIAVVAIAFGLVIDNLANPFGGIIPLPMMVAFSFTLVWMVGMINTVNLLDTMDGLATGIGGIAAAFLFLHSNQLGQHSIAVLPLALAGACAGFLPHNFNPARIIMGSSGSLLLGFTLAVLAIIGGAKIATAVMLLGLPIVDVALVIVLRASQGRSPLRGGDGAHLPHRLVAIGLSRRLVALLLYAMCALGGLLALSLTSVEKLYLFIAVGLALATVSIALALKLGLAPGERRGTDS